jgi:hypothetical protein
MLKVIVAIVALIVSLLMLYAARFLSAEEGTRTPTSLRPLAPEARKPRQQRRFSQYGSRAKDDEGEPYTSDSATKTATRKPFALARRPDLLFGALAYADPTDAVRLRAATTAPGWGLR